MKRLLVVILFISTCAIAFFTIGYLIYGIIDIFFMKQKFRINRTPYSTHTLLLGNNCPAQIITIKAGYTRGKTEEPVQGTYTIKNMLNIYRQAFKKQRVPRKNKKFIKKKAKWGGLLK